ncbi:peptidylprolyl isomerase [Patescibacteria group bacterium]|nr:peptidylprolyl isomerase [Patescibacteria group bacterium]
MNFKALSILIFVPLVIIILVIVFKDKTLMDGNPYDAQSQRDPVIVTNKLAVPPPDTKLDITKDYKVILKTTEGDVTIKVDALDTVMASTNFVYLARIGYYDGLTFHRIIKDFMIQSGCPIGDGTGGPGYTFNDEPFDDDYKRGAVAMANSGPNTNGSQFFIVHQDSPELPKNYVIFGKVIEGMDTVDRIANTPVSDNGMGEVSKPNTPVNIISAEVTDE